MTPHALLMRQAGEARIHLQRCGLCEHRCGADRTAGERGPCGAGVRARLFRHRVEYGEELELVPSHLFYLSGCDFRCAFCIAGINAFDARRGEELTPERFRTAVDWGRGRGAKNIQWVGGEPTIHLPAILDLMTHCPTLPPIVWKSDFYGSPQAFDLLDGIADTYVADFKFGNDACAQRLAGVKDYLSVVTRNLLHVADRGRLIVRHLLLPGHAACCYEPIVRWMSEHLPDVPFSIRDSYLPSWRAARSSELGRVIDPQESTTAHTLAARFGLAVIS